MYPAPMTEDITSFVYAQNGRLKWYVMPREDDGFLALIQPSYKIQRGEMFRVEYTEVFNGGTPQDNRGTSCVAVDFLFLSCDDGSNLPTHNCSGAPTSRDAVRTIPEVLVE